MSGVRDESMAIWISAGVSAVNCGATFIGLFLVDRVGRRKLVLLSYIGKLKFCMQNLFVLNHQFTLIWFSSSLLFRSDFLSCTLRTWLPHDGR